MQEIKGRFGSAIAYARNLDAGSVGQLTALCNQPLVHGQKLRVMPDAHAGSGCVIGTTLTVTDKIIPNLVGVDIGCGMEVVNIGRPRLDFRKLDTIIASNVPSGPNLRKKAHRFAESWDQDRLLCGKILNRQKTASSVGTLGGGNHFIEVSVDVNSGEHYLIVHSGSRAPGFQVASHYQNIAGDKKSEETPFNLAWLEGEEMKNYVHDMEIMQEFASLNRQAIVDEILRGMKWKAADAFTTVHNYLDTELMILRKGAVSARKGERLLIPMNMRDGSLICEGLGNPEWNFSAPHGAGRLFSRSEARDRLTLTQFKKEMTGIYSSSISRATIDESPGAYKPMEEIVAQIGETVKISSHLKPLYNFKAGE